MGFSHMPLKLAYRGQTSIPVEIEGLVPTVVRELPLPDIERWQLFHGNEKLPLAEFFTISGDPSDGRMEFEGNLAGVHWIGAGMTEGAIHVAGNAGRHVGSEMLGGEIHVHGSAGDWVGGEMHGGLIHVRGRAGHLVGAAYRGSRRGMTGGTILIHGDVGNELGHTMRRGLIAVGGAAGDFVGINMIAGTILVFGEPGIRAGAGMNRGTIGLFGSQPVKLLPSFTQSCSFEPLALRLVFRELRRLGFPLRDEMLTATFDLYHGDLVAQGRGEVFLTATA